MPHQCTDCGRTFEDGSKEMLSGCPDCGGNKFQFHPDGVDDDPPETEKPPEPPEPAVDNTVARTVGNAATAVRDLVGGGDDSSPIGSDPRPESSGPDSDGAPPSWRDQPSESDGTDPAQPASADKSGSTTAKMAETEDAAQASARSEVVSPEDIPSAPETQATQRSTPVSDNATTPEQHDGDERDRPDLSELRDELNQQFESIRVLEPGQYELNLMELYDREEYIVALQEDGKYTIQVPERWED
jgi:predicted  nucleic acid-binding Zn-ribbon protein